MRSPTILVSFASMCLVTSATVALAQETYRTAIGREVVPLDVFKDCGACPEMIVLPMGTFRMGSTVAEANAANLRFFTNSNVETSTYEEKLRQSFLRLGIDPDSPEAGLLRYYASEQYNQQADPQYSINPMLHEVPAHQVMIDMPIAMGRNEVTREEWAACVEDGGCERGQSEVPVSEYVACEKTAGCVPTPDARIAFRLQTNPRPTHPRGPRVGITYYEAVDYVAWLNKKVGADVYRLPTEAEWEYAAKAGTNTRFAQGDTLTLDQANFMVSRREIINGEYIWNHDLGSAGMPLPVDELTAANGWGLRHMSGNVGEITSTCGDGPHRGFSTSSGYLEADKNTPDCERSVKGGSFAGDVELSRPARRVAISSDHWSDWIGFRIVRDLVPVLDTAD